MNNTMKITKRNVAKALRQTAKMIETYGFNKGTFGSKSEGFCTLGAIREVKLSDDSYWTEAGYQFSKALGGQVHEAFMRNFGDDRISRVNDRPETTKEMVLGVLRAEAALLEHGGKLAGPNA